MRRRRSSTARQPESIRSTSSPRSSTRELRSASSSVSIRSRRADRLVREAPDLSQLARHGPRLDSDPVADGLTHAVRKARLEFGGGRREGLDLRSGPLEGRLDVAGLRLFRAALREALAGAIESASSTEGDDSVSAG